MAEDFPEELPEVPSHEEIEAGLDAIVPEMLEFLGGRTAIRGWPVLFKIGLGFDKIGAAEVPYLTEAGADALVKLAASNPLAFDAASYVAGMQVVAEPFAGGKNFPLALRVFAARVLAGEIERPSQPGRKRVSDAPLRMWQFALCHAVSKLAHLPLGGNREPKGEARLNACRAVSEAFGRAGHNVTANQLQSLCFDEPSRDVREAAACIGLLDLRFDVSEGRASRNAN